MESYGVGLYNHPMETIRSIAVFSGASFGNKPEYKEAAVALGKAIGSKGLTLIYGGGYCGLMGAIAETAGKAGSHVIGVLPEAMNTKDVRLKDVETELIIVPDMHERKSRMYGLADAFIAAPGGIGTMEELSEIYTWRQLGYHSKNIALYNPCGYWDPFIRMIDRGNQEGFISEAVRNILIVESDPERLLEKLAEKSCALPVKHG